jgi:hypothetical protein
MDLQVVAGVPHIWRGLIAPEVGDNEPETCLGRVSTAACSQIF